MKWGFLFFYISHRMTLSHPMTYTSKKNEALAFSSLKTPNWL